ncbi:MAG: L-2-hydroxyglutarate oxidase [Mycobacteriaceae bacterium]
MTADFCVIGAGIVGLATAMALLEQRPGCSIVVLEKEEAPARHQSGHNSGVIHSGIYYEPGSLKAKLCRQGATATKEFCVAQNIPVRVLGKLIVATNDRDVARMAELQERAARNDVAVDHLSAADLQEREPQVRGREALLVPETASVDYALVCRAIERVVTAGGGTLELGVKVTGIAETPTAVTVVAGARQWTARQLLVCGGLQADRLARMAGITSDVRIVPFRGEYYQLPEHKRNMVSHLIYPVPDPELPFLGVHLTPMVDGRVTVGPNAVLGLAREGYRKGSANAADIADFLRFPGFWQLARKHLSTGALELRNSWFKHGFLHSARRYCPGLELADLLPFEAGIRAQAVLRDGTLLHDFHFLRTDRMLHVINAPSPAATSAIPIGQHIATRCLDTSS